MFNIFSVNEWKANESNEIKVCITKYYLNIFIKVCNKKVFYTLHFYYARIVFKCVWNIYKFQWMIWCIL